MAKNTQRNPVSRKDTTLQTSATTGESNSDQNEDQAKSAPEPAKVVQSTPPHETGGGTFTIGEDGVRRRV